MRKVVVITGASAGIGRATAVEFARRGARVALLARGEEGLRGALRELEQAGGEGLMLRTDVADPAQVEAAAEQVERAWGPIDVWVNNAMATVVSPFLDIAPEDFRRVTETTYLGAARGQSYGLRSTREEKSASAHRRCKACSATCSFQVSSIGCLPEWLTAASSATTYCPQTGATTCMRRLLPITGRMPL